MDLKTLADAAKLQQQFAKKMKLGADDLVPTDPETVALVAKRQHDLLDQLTARLESARQTREETVRRLDADIARQEKAVEALRKSIEPGKPKKKA